MADAFTGAIFRWLDAVAADRRLPAGAFRLAYVISQHINRSSHTAWPSQETLARAMGGAEDDESSTRVVRRSLKALVDTGYILTTRRRQTSQVYRLAQDRTEISYQGETREDEIVRSTDQDRTILVARPDENGRQDRTISSAKPLIEPLKEPERERARAKTIPEDWKLSDVDHDFALGEGVQNIDGMAAAFVDHYRGNGQQRADWSAVWRGWVRRERQFSKSGSDRLVAKLREAADPTGLTDDAWDGLLRTYARTGIWSRHVDVVGPDPASAACRAPRHLLAKYGFEVAA